MVLIDALGGRRLTDRDSRVPSRVFRVPPIYVHRDSRFEIEHSPEAALACAGLCNRSISYGFFRASMKALSLKTLETASRIAASRVSCALPGVASSIHSWFCPVIYLS